LNRNSGTWKSDRKSLRTGGDGQRKMEQETSSGKGLCLSLFWEERHTNQAATVRGAKSATHTTEKDTLAEMGMIWWGRGKKKGQLLKSLSQRGKVPERVQQGYRTAKKTFM